MSAASLARLHWLHDPVLAPAAPDVLEVIRDTPASHTTEPREGERRPRRVATELLPSCVVAGLDAHIGVEVESVKLDGTDEARALGLPVHRELTLVCERCGLATGHRDGSAGVNRCLHGWLLRTRVRSAVEVAVTAEPVEGSALHTLDHRLKLHACGRRGSMKLDALFSPRPHAVRRDDVKMQIEIQTRAEPLNKVNSSALCPFEPAPFRPRAVATEERLHEDAPQSREHFGVEGCQFLQLEGERQHVLTDGDLREDAVHDRGPGVAPLVSLAYVRLRSRGLSLRPERRTLSQGSRAEQLPTLSLPLRGRSFLQEAQREPPPGLSERR